MVSVHPTAVVEKGAGLAEGVVIGPFCVVSGQAVIGAGTILANNVTLAGSVSLGAGNRVYPYAVVGGDPQDVRYAGSASRVVVGDRNVIREHVTVSRGTDKESGDTVIGNGNYLMAACHVAHDCVIGDHVVLANGVLLGGHVRVHSHASLSGGVAVHHWVTIGSWSFVAGLSRVLHDVPPFMLSEGMPAWPRCINSVGLQRGGFSQMVIGAIGESYRLLFRAKVGVDSAREVLASQEMLLPDVVCLLDFVSRQQSGRHGRGREQRRAA